MINVREVVSSLKSMQLLQSYEDSYFSHGDSVSIVGSSGKLLKQKQSENIDSGDDVCRFNSAPVDGFENFVGSKTTIRVCNVHSILTPLDKSKAIGLKKRFKDFDENYLLKIKNTNLIFKNPKHTIPLKTTQYFPLLDKVLNNNNNVFFLTPESDQYIRRLLMSKEPSAGFVGLAMAIKYFSSIKCYGFTFNDLSVHQKYYYRPESENSTGNCHNFNLEQAIFLNLNNKGVINLI